LKILIDGRLISDKETGISRYSEELLKIYIDLFGAENISLIVDEKLKKQFSNIKVYKTSLYPFSIKDFFIFHKFLKNIDFDVYHSMFYSNSFFKLKNKIYITTVHDLMYKLVPNFFSKNRIKNRLAVFYFDFIVKRSLKNSDIVITISQSTKNDLEKYYKTPSIVITEGFNELISEENNLEIETNLIKPKEYFLYVGNNRPHKNIEFLKKCYLKANTDKKLIIVGHKGENIKEGNKEILYTGYINDYTLRYLYKNAAAFVFPSLYEGFGLPILEAINLNTLVFSSDRGSLKEFGENNIYYFNPVDEDSLIELLEKVEEMQFDNSKKDILLNKFNWNVVKKQIDDLYKKLIL